MSFYWGKELPGWTFTQDPGGSAGYYRMEEPGCLIILEQQLLGSFVIRLFLGGHLEVSVLEKSIKRGELLELLYLAPTWMEEYREVGRSLLSLSLQHT